MDKSLILGFTIEKFWSEDWLFFKFKSVASIEVIHFSYILDEKTAEESGTVVNAREIAGKVLGSYTEPIPS